MANPSDFGGSVFIDLSADGLITLTGDVPSGLSDYDLATFTIFGIDFDVTSIITGVTTLTEGLLDPDYEVGAFSPVISFTADSVSFLFDRSGSGSVSDFQFLDGGTSTYQLVIETAAVPLPASLPLLLAGLGGLAYLRRRPAKA